MKKFQEEGLLSYLPERQDTDSLPAIVKSMCSAPPHSKCQAGQGQVGSLYIPTTVDLWGGEAGFRLRREATGLSKG